MQDKPYPNSVQAEQAVLGGVLLDNSGYWRCSVTEDDFYRHDHRLIWRALCALSDQGSPCDVVTVGEWLEQQGCFEEAGGFGYLGSLAKDAPGTANLEYYAGIVSDKARQRAMLTALQGAHQAVSNGEAPETALANILATVERSTRGGYSDFAALDGQLEAHLAAVATKGDQSLPLGLPALDHMLSIEGPQLVIVAGRPSLGKTAMALQWMAHSGKRHGIKGAFVSLETDGIRVAARLNAHLYQVSVSGLLRGWPNTIEAYRKKKAERPYKLPMFVEENTYDLNGIIARINEWRRKHEIEWVVVDHLQLVDHAGNNRNEALGEVTRRFKLNAKRLGIPHVLISQLSRDSEKHGRKPMMSDLRDSGNIEQDADIVVALEGGIDTNNDGWRRVNVGILKNKDGETGWLDGIFQFDGATQTFRENEREEKAA